MSSHFVIFEQKPGDTGVVVIAKTPEGERFAVAHGATIEEALAELRGFVGSSMATLAEGGENPLVVLGHGPEASHPAANMSTRELFPIMLRFLRRSLGLTQAEVAERMLVSQPAYAKWELFGANPQMETLDLLERALGAPVLIFRKPVAA